MEEAVGTITLVQEGRFRLAAGTGGQLHFTLHRHARTEAQDLPALMREGTRVRVRYGAPGDGRTTLAAHEVRPEARA